MTISDRQEKLLDIIVREYINSAQPVSSQVLEKKYNFGICPASIRLEMQKLEDKDFLFQPHISAGRVPTDKGYRFFVNKLLVKGKNYNKELKTKEIKKIIEKELDNTVRLFQTLIKNLSLFSPNLFISYLLKEEILWKEGWEKILIQPEFRERETVSKFTKFIENFEENIEKINLDSNITIYIGNENPFLKTKDFSIISVRCYFLDEEGIISILGPKRMAYDKNIDIMNSLVGVLANIKE